MNNDGRKDLDQIQQKSSEIGQSLENATRDLGQKAGQQVDRLDTTLPDLNDLDRNWSGWGSWLIIGLVALVIIVTIAAALRRKRTWRTYHYR